MTAHHSIIAALMSLAMLGGVPLFAETPTIVEQAIENMEKTDIDDWSYTVTTSRNGKKTVERHDATKPEGSRWQLLLKNGEPPTADEIAEYLAAKRDQAERRRRRGKEQRESEISAMVDPSTLTLLADEPTRATYSFRMKVDDEDDARFADHVEATLVVDKVLPHVERLEMKSTDEFKPMTGVKISEFRVLMRFDRDDVSGAILPLTIATTIKGRAFLVKSLDEDIVISFTDYKPPVK